MSCRVILFIETFCNHIIIIDSNLLFTKLDQYVETSTLQLIKWWFMCLRYRWRRRSVGTLLYNATSPIGTTIFYTVSIMTKDFYYVILSIKKFGRIMPGKEKTWEQWIVLTILILNAVITHSLVCRLGRALFWCTH